MSACPNCGWEHELSMAFPVCIPRDHITYGIIPIRAHSNHERKIEYFSQEMDHSWFKLFNKYEHVDKFVPVEKRNFIPVSKGSAGSMIRTMSVKQHKIYRKKKNAERKRKFKRRG
jgi:hypothetical protein